eukprot:GFYU01045967.1.p1 GENE.GFYU01045967.1~~GFYU01045967.1.p1  ORF type:complete len:499 (+),score=41.98 GFYU01045967.1:96-1499(+)
MTKVEAIPPQQYPAQDVEEGDSVRHPGDAQTGDSGSKDETVVDSHDSPPRSTLKPTKSQVKRKEKEVAGVLWFKAAAVLTGYSWDLIPTYLLTSLTSDHVVLCRLAWTIVATKLSVLIVYKLSKRILALDETMSRDRYWEQLFVFWLGASSMIASWSWKSFLVEIGNRQQGDKELFKFIIAIVCTILGVLTTYLYGKRTAHWDAETAKERQNEKTLILGMFCLGVGALWHEALTHSLVNIDSPGFYIIGRWIWAVSVTGFASLVTYRTAGVAQAGAQTFKIHLFWFQATCLGFLVGWAYSDAIRAWSLGPDKDATQSGPFVLVSAVAITRVATLISARLSFVVDGITSKMKKQFVTLIRNAMALIVGWSWMDVAAWILSLFTSADTPLWQTTLASALFAAALTAFISACLVIGQYFKERQAQAGLVAPEPDPVAHTEGNAERETEDKDLEMTDMDDEDDRQISEHNV